LVDAEPLVERAFDRFVLTGATAWAFDEVAAANAHGPLVKVVPRRMSFGARQQRHLMWYLALRHRLTSARAFAPARRS
jgi:hypothetical protein